MKTIVNKYKEAARKGGAAYWNAVARVKELESKKDGYYKPTYDALMSEAKANLSKAESDAKLLIRKARIEAESIIKEHYKPNGNSIDTGVVNLLNSGVSLSTGEIDNLLKEADGVTMQRIIADHANKNNIAYSGKFIDEESKLNQLNQLDAIALSGLQRDFYYNDVINNDATFSEVARGAFTASTFVNDNN